MDIRLCTIPTHHMLYIEANQVSEFYAKSQDPFRKD